MKGTVKWFSPQKGYGFIQGEDGQDYFAHQTRIQMEGYRKLVADEKVSFSAAKDDTGRPVADAIVREGK
ncbi:MAG: cold shock domain-containing protein [Clostridiales bacterium]|nr:cold shock domain-containing protein [Clostridiales bacterium]